MFFDTLPISQNASYLFIITLINCVFKQIQTLGMHTTTTAACNKKVSEGLIISGDSRPFFDIYATCSSLEKLFINWLKAWWLFQNVHIAIKKGGGLRKLIQKVGNTDVMFTYLSSTHWTRGFPIEPSWNTFFAKYVFAM